MANPFVGQIIRCAGPGCEHVRKDCNHWFLVFTTRIAGSGFDMNRFSVEPLILDEGEGMEIIPKDCKPVCGSACAQKLFEQYLNSKAKWVTAGMKALESLANAQKGKG